MKAFYNRARNRSEIPCEGNCPYLVVTDTLSCRKDSEGVVDMEEVRDAGECPFWPREEPGYAETLRNGIYGYSDD